MVIVTLVLIQISHRWWDDKEMRQAATIVRVTDHMTIILITITVALKVVMMKVVIPFRDYNKDAALIVVVMKIAYNVKTMIVTILQRLHTSHKVSTQDQSYPHRYMRVWMKMTMMQTKMMMICQHEQGGRQLHYECEEVEH